MQERTVFVVSDRTGITAEMLSHSLLTQFPNIRFHTVAMPYVDSPEKARAAVERINGASALTTSKPLVFTTLLNDEIHDVIAESNGFCFDFFDAFVGPLERVLGESSSHTSGRAHGVGDVERYSSRISAVDFAQACDDGLRTEEYERADIILTGVSRSGKTPTCLYMALQFGIFAGNYPMTDSDLDRSMLPKTLANVREKLFGLTIDPARLMQIRRERRPNSPYSDIKECRREVASVENIFKAESIPFMDVTAMSIEEIATTILDKKDVHRDLF
ncbi:MAG: kinase/pyrophosphorylase [Gammaproteobacteria bacterium]|nr:kinase/pyrophosphorylase [Gammaproteobacteria bacterium]